MRKVKIKDLIGNVELSPKEPVVITIKQKGIKFKDVLDKSGIELNYNEPSIVKVKERNKIDT